MKYFLTFIFLILSSCTIGGDFSITGKWNNGNFEYSKNLDFSDSTVREFGFDPEKQEKYENTFSYVLLKNANIWFLKLNRKDYILMNYENKAFRLISENASEFWFRNPKNNKLYNREMISRIGNVTANSELREGNRLYSAANLINGKGVWASSNQNYSEIRINFSVIGNTKGIYIGNGFLSYSAPNLFIENSRAQNIRIRNISTKRELSFSLKDTIQPQYLMLSEIMEDSKNQNNFEMQIDSIYNGSKYSDLCLWELRSDNILE